MNRVRFIATIGPSSLDEKIISGMVRAGAVSFRLNTAHIEVNYIKKVKRIVRNIKVDGTISPSIILDLKGPEVRATFKGKSELNLIRGKIYKVGSGGSKSDIILNAASVVGQLGKGDKILLSDGKIQMNVTDSKDDIVYAKAMNEGLLRNNARVNLPDKELNLGSLTERDKMFLNEGIKEDIEFFALSFVQSAKNVEEFREEILEKGGDQFVISKIETGSGVKNIDRICKSSDMIMVARGDLGVELPLEEISMIQKEIIRKAHSYGIPSIVATQMLESMVENDEPTRAEVNDISNAILDNADILMLSEETAIGKHPLEAVETLNKVTKYVESRLYDYPEPQEFIGNTIAYAVAKSAKNMSSEVKADIIALTRSGSTVKMLSALRPRGKIYAVSGNDRLIRKLYLYHNTYPLPLDIRGNSIEEITDGIINSGHFKKGELLIVTSGEPYFPFGGTNDVRYIIVGNFIGRGASFGPSATGRITREEGKGEILVVDRKSKLDLGARNKAFLFAYPIKFSLIENLISEGKTVVTSVVFKKRPREGESVIIDSRTGIIYN